MTPDPTETRATAKRLAREVYERMDGRPGGAYPVHMMTEAALAGMSHRDRTAEREAARKAWDAAARFTEDECKMPSPESFTRAREAYLAAEFDAGERTECERCGGLMPAHERQYSSHLELAACVNFLAATIKRLAEQRGAER